MLKIGVVTCLLATLAVASSANTKVFHFTTAKDMGQKVFNFEYTLDKGKKFTGRAIQLYRFSREYLMMGAKDTFYWTTFNLDEIENKNSFDKVVNYFKVDRSKPLIAHLMDDFVSYDIYSAGVIEGGPYDTIWNVDNVAFQLADRKSTTFNYVIYSKNNGRQHRGKTSFVDDAHVQKVIVPDHHECYLFQATFTDKELKSSETIYKPLDRTKVCEVPPPPARAPVPPTEVDPNALKSLVG